MKKFYLLFGLFYISFCYSQNEIEKKVANIESSKSGNYKDVLHNLLQLTTRNVSNEIKSLELNSTLFNIMYGSDLNDISDLTIMKSTFLRNFQINAKTNFNSDFKYQGFSGGLTYAIINGRDKARLNLTVGKVNYSKESELFRLKFIKIQAKLAEGLNINSQELLQLNEASQDILDGKEIDATKNPYYEKIIDAFDKIEHTETGIEEKKLKDGIAYLKQIKKNEYDNIESRPLWTLSMDGSTNTEGKFNQASISTIFLKGNSKSKYEFDIRSKIIYSDTVANQHLPRMDFKATVGINLKLGKDKKNSSFFEIKPYFEYNSILKETSSNLNIASENIKNKFILNTELRVRLTENLWIPLTIKYDLDHANVLGFLNVTYNFEDFLNQK